MTPEELAKAYLKNYRSGNDDDFWAYEDVIEACTDLQLGTEITLSIIAESENEMELAYVAAGPLEDILKIHGNKAIGAFEKESENSEKVRNALADVYINEKYEAYHEWKKLMKKYVFWKEEKTKK